MIDTIRINGSKLKNSFKPTSMQHLVYTSIKSGETKSLLSLIFNKKAYRIFYSPGSRIYTVELNIQKLIYEHNIYNYSFDAFDLHSLVYVICSGFFYDLSDVCISRIDLGLVFNQNTGKDSAKLLDTFRNARPDKIRVAKFLHQNYQSTVWYRSENYSIKIYDKSAELKHSFKGEIPDDLKPLVNGMLRYEKTYRFGEFKRLGMDVVPSYGTPLNKFDVSRIIADAYTVFTSWERNTVPYHTDEKRAIGLLSVLDNLGALGQVEIQKIVSKSTMHRYRKKRKEQYINDEYIQKINIENNLPSHLQNKLQNVLTLGLDSLLWAQK